MRHDLTANHTCGGVLTGSVFAGLCKKEVVGLNKAAGGGDNSRHNRTAWSSTPVCVASNGLGRGANLKAKGRQGKMVGLEESAEVHHQNITNTVAFVNSSVTPDWRCKSAHQIGDNAGMQNRIRALRERAGISQQALADLAETSAQQIQRLEAGSRKLTVDWMVRLAPHLDADPAALMDETSIPLPARVGDEASFNRVEAVRRRVDWIPIQGGARGGDDQQMFWTDGLGYTPRPPSLENVNGAYSVYMVGDSMCPRYEPGWLLYVNPIRPAGFGRAVIVRKQDGCVLVKIYKGWDGDDLLLEQFNPNKIIRVERKSIEAIHVIVGTQEGG